MAEITPAQIREMGIDLDLQFKEDLDNNFQNLANKDVEVISRVNNIIAADGESNIEIVDARHSVVKEKTYNVLTERLNAAEEDIDAIVHIDKEVVNETARYALTTDDVSLNNIVKQLDGGILYIVTDTANLNNATGYTLYKVCATNHTHTINDITDLSLTAGSITDFDTEVSNNTDVSANTLARHAHDNMEVLDATTASYTLEDKDVLAFLFNNLASIVNIKDFGAISGAADNTTPIQNAINTLTKNKILLIPDGSYNITGVTVPMRDVTIIFIGELVFTASSGYALTLGHYHINLINPKIRRVYTGTGVASSDLVGVGLCLHHAKNCTIYNPIIEGFGVGIAYRDSVGVGVAYNTIFNPILTNNLESIKSIYEHANSWTNENKVFGGRVVLVTSTYSDITGSSYFNLLGDCHRFYGVSAEGTPERKIKGTFHESTFDGCRFELTNGVLDIEINGSGNKFIGNRDYEDIYVDNGLNNVILSRWYAKFGQPIQQPVSKVKTVYSGDNYYGINLEPNYCYYLIDANDNKAYVTPRLSSYSIGSIFTIKKIDSSSNPIVLGIANLDNNQINPTLTKQNETIRIMYDGDKFIVLDNSEYSYSLGYSHITYGVGAKRKYYPTESGYMKYGSRVCIEEGTTGTFTNVTGTGTVGTNTLTLTGILDRMTSNSWITVGDVNYYVTAWDAVTKVATLKTNLAVSLSGATVSRKNPKFAKAERILFEDIAVPTTGTWGKGDIVYNSNPIAGGYVGWICITAGTPGTWKGFGLIQS